MGSPGYFITMPQFQNIPCKRIELPFVSESHMQIAYYSCMVVVEVFDKERQRPVSTYFDDNTPWDVFKAHWEPTWQLRHYEKIEIGLPGFSTNTSPTVLPPQHILGQIHQPITITSREKLIELGDLTRLRSADTQWYDHTTRSWMRSPVYHFFQINHMRALADWPQQNPENLVSGINYGQYKEMWFNAFLWTSRFNFFYCMIKFAHEFREWEEPDWLINWWKTFGLNPVGINPDVTETGKMFIHFTRPLDYISDLFSEEEYMEMFIREKHPWIIRTKFLLHPSENTDHDPDLMRHVYTQHWDPYYFNHFKDRPFD
jgi:hypothetical protein